MKLRIAIAMLFAAGCCAWSAPARAYAIRFDAFGSGGGMQTGATFDLGFTVGQPAIGLGADASATQFDEDAGFWHLGEHVVLGVDGPGTPAVITAFALDPVAPNPFAGRTTIRYAIPGTAGEVRTQVAIFDLSGRLVRALDRGVRGAGLYTVTWDGRDAAGRPLGGGMYFLRFTAGGYEATRRLVLIRP